MGSFVVKYASRVSATEYAAIAQSVERILGKDEVASSNLASSSNLKFAAIAQPVERILGKDEVASSNLASSSKETPKFMLRGFCFIELKLTTLSISTS